jgi:lysophospholipase L1-like esterase
MSKAEKFSSFVLATGAVICVAGLLYVAYVFDLSAAKQFTGPAVAFVYHAVPAVLAVLCLAGLLLRPAARINLALVLVSAVFSLYAGELLLSSAPSFLSAAPEGVEAAGMQFDRRSKIQVIEDLRANGINALPTVTPAVLLQRQPDRSLKSAITLNAAETLPLGWVSNSYAVFCNENGYWVSFESDERGFHNPRGIWTAERVQIAAVGDSFAQGYCVPSDRNFVALIRERHPATLNLAIAGNGPLLNLAGIEEYLRSVQPPIVLWFHAEINDLCGLEIERHSALLMRYVTGPFSQGLPAKQAEIDSAISSYLDRVTAAYRFQKWRGILTLKNLREQLGLIHTSREDMDRYHYRHYGCNEIEGAMYPRSFGSRDAELLRRVLAKARDSVGSWGGVLYFVYLPEWQRYRNPSMANPYRAEVLQLARSLEIPVIDVHETFEAQKDPLAMFPFRRQGHYSAEGHQRTAEAVLRALPAHLK